MPKLKDIKLKICGLRDNINEIVAVKPDYVGFIFYDKSPRYVGDDFEPSHIASIPKEIKKIGVFVDAPLAEVVNKVKKYDLQMVQLHGFETVEYCKALKADGITVIKVFSGNNELDWMEFKVYEEVCDYFLFDTRAKQLGGSGKTFDWSRLASVHLTKPIFLSGGIDLENVEGVEKIENVLIHAIDVNSKFEISPGLKDVTLVKQLKEKMLCDTV